MPTNPFKGWRLDGVDVEEVIWTRAQVEKFIRTADQMGLPSVGTAAMLAFELCQRQGDVLRLPWGQYDGDRIHIRQEKTGAHVDTRVPPQLKARLEAMPPRGTLIVMPDQIEMRRRVVTSYSPNTFRQHVKRVSAAAHLPKKLKFMHLRSSGATETGDAGGTDAEVMSITGHKTRAMVTKYTKRTPKQADNAMAKRQAARTNGRQESE